MEIPISCPACRHKYRLKAANPGALMDKTFQCPKCGASVPFSRLLAPGQPGVPGGGGAAVPPPPSAEMKTHIGGRGMSADAGMKTHLGGQGSPGNPDLHTHLGGQGGPFNPGMRTQIHNGGNVGGVDVRQVPRLQAALVVPALKRQFQLPAGQYILGRESSDSQANVRIAPDPCMSRRHAHLQIAAGPAGAPIVTLTGLQSRNDIFVNNTRMSAGASVVLNPGDEILLGNTIVRFLLK